MRVQFLPICASIALLALGREAHGADDKKDEFIKLPSDIYVIKNADAAKLGKEAAVADFAAGHYRVLSYGLMAAPTEADRKLEKLGIRIEDIAGCIVSEGIVGFAHGYNSTMQPLLKKKFGPDVFKGTKAGRQ